MEIRRNRQAPKNCRKIPLQGDESRNGAVETERNRKAWHCRNPAPLRHLDVCIVFPARVRKRQGRAVCERPCFGNDKPLGEISLAVERGQKIGVIGSNGTGKSTLLKTITGIIPPLSGDVRFGVKTRVGYFDQTIAATKSELSVLEDFRAEFPELNDGEIRKRWEDSCFRATTFSSASKICRAAKRCALRFQNIPPSSQLPDSRRADQPHGHHRQGNP